MTPMTVLKVGEKHWNLSQLVSWEWELLPTQIPPPPSGVVYARVLMVAFTAGGFSMADSGHARAIAKYLTGLAFVIASEYLIEPEKT